MENTVENIYHKRNTIENKSQKNPKFISDFLLVYSPIWNGYYLFLPWPFNL
jgi:hypothetical protein